MAQSIITESPSKISSQAAAKTFGGWVSREMAEGSSTWVSSGRMLQTGDWTAGAGSPGAVLDICLSLEATDGSVVPSR